jgi:hypothetical protein
MATRRQRDGRAGWVASGTEKVEALRSGSTVDDPGLGLGEGQVDFAQHFLEELQGGFGLPSGPTQDHEIIRVADELAYVLPPLPRLIQAVQIDVGQHALRRMSVRWTLS